MPRRPTPSSLARLTPRAGRGRAPWHGPPPRLPSLLDRLSERWFGLPPRVRSGLLAATGLLLLLATGLGAARSPWGPPAPVLVLAGDVDAGDVLDPRVLRTERRPAGLLPPDAIRDAGEVAGARAAGRLVAGTVLTARHLAGDDGVTSGLAGDRAAYPVDAGVLPPVVPGQRLDLVAGDLDGRGRTLARDVRVLAVVDATVWLDVARDDAAAIAGAALRDGLHVVLLPPA